MEEYRKVVAYKNYFNEFLNTQSSKIQQKILFTIRIIKSLKIVPVNYLKHIEGTTGLYEIRVKFGRKGYRIFCLFDENQLVILLNGFQKKTKKTPKAEIIKAMALMKEYYTEKTRT
ncbi:MAG: type II toxin-antitoxin system RelE/ParE family toxin [Bacteroidales bacterium]|nr:type II toxin-antitoxin system RelE/ParE family toxin [Bacteroidales bacterium]